MSANDDSKYRGFWPVVARAWKNLGIQPVLVYFGDDGFEREARAHGEVIRLEANGVDPAYATQNIRLLVPALFPGEVSVTTDIDLMPLSAAYFQTPIRGIAKDTFVIYRSAAATAKDQIAMCYAAAEAGVWSEIFGVRTLDDCKKTLQSLFKSETCTQTHTLWYGDQRNLKRSIDQLRESAPNRVLQLNDFLTGFHRLDRDQKYASPVWRSLALRMMRGSMRQSAHLIVKLAGYDGCHSLLNRMWRASWFHDALHPDWVGKTNPALAGHTDYHMPRPYAEHQDVINKVYALYFGDWNALIREA